jgi:hypothetical protein
MRLDEIVIVPGDEQATVVDGAGSRQVPIRTERAFDEFAAELGGATEAGVRVVDGPDLPAAGVGTVFVCREAVLDRATPALASRVVAVDVSRTRALPLAEERCLAAVIESYQYFSWHRRRGSGDAAALYGRKDVGRRMGAHWPEIPLYEGQHYALLSHDSYPELPILLAAYLDEYARAVP